MANDSGLPHIKELNQLMSQHYDALKALDKIDGQVVKGGRLGNILRGHTVAGIGAIAANAMGGGVLGTVGAAMGGEAANDFLSKVLGDTSFTNPIRDAILNKIKTENPDVVAELQKALSDKGKLPSSLQGKIGAQLAPQSNLSNISGIAGKTGLKGLIRLGAGVGSGQ